MTLLLGISGVACCVAMSMPQVHIVAYCADLSREAVAQAELARHRAQITDLRRQLQIDGE